MTAAPTHLMLVLTVVSYMQANTKAYYSRGSDYDVLEFRFHPTGGEVSMTDCTLLLHLTVWMLY